MTRQEKKADGLARKLISALLKLHEYDGDPQDVLTDAKVLLNSKNNAAGKEAKEMVYYLERRLDE